MKFLELRYDVIKLSDILTPVLNVSACSDLICKTYCHEHGLAVIKNASPFPTQQKFALVIEQKDIIGPAVGQGCVSSGNILFIPSSPDSKFLKCSNKLEILNAIFPFWRFKNFKVLCICMSVCMFTRVCMYAERIEEERGI